MTQRCTMDEVSLWICPGLFFRSQRTYGSGYGSWLIVAAKTLPVVHEQPYSVDNVVPSDAICARFVRVAPHSWHYCLEKGPPPGWRWIVHKGQLIADRV